MRNCDDPNPKKRAHFEQPVIQTLQMFVGEMGCWLVVGLMSLYNKYVAKQGTAAAAYQPVPTADNGDGPDNASIRSHTALNGSVGHKHGGQNVLRGWRVLLLAAPSTCDICGTTLMNVGLLLVAASIYQMTRGALVLFVGVFSVVFLRRKLHLFQWLSLVGVMTGVAIVGLAGAIQPDKKHVGTDLPHASTADIGSDAARVIVGVLMIAGAQIFTATQFVLEEWILERSDIEPLRVVGWEGFFGFTVTLLGMAVLHLAIGRTEAGHLGPFDMVEGWRQFWEYRPVFISSVLIMISIGYAPPSPPLPTETSQLTPPPLSQRLQLLRPLGNPLRQCHVALHDRHVPHPLHLDGLPRPRLGDVQVAAGGGLRAARLLYLFVQRHRPAAARVPQGPRGRGAAARGAH